MYKHKQQNLMNGEAHAVQNTLELQNRKRLAKILIVAQVKYYNISNKAYQCWTFLILTFKSSNITAMFATTGYGAF